MGNHLSKETDRSKKALVEAELALEKIPNTVPVVAQ